MLEIIYRDDHLIAVNKPHGLLVHRSRIAADADQFALQMLRDQINQWVNPVHRLDRKTSGVLLFALDKDAETAMHQQFAAGTVKKRYLAVLRGYTPDHEDINYPLKKDNGIMQEAFTSYRTLGRAEIPVPFRGHDTSRYSLIEAEPSTGRMHQLRRHFAHILHPIIGDRKHGCNKQNKLFKETWNMTTMLLHASSVSFKHPVTDKYIDVKAPLHQEFLRILHIMGWSTSFTTH